jgi:ankyrin repeat protein
MMQGATADDGHAERVARFLTYACPDHHVRTGAAHTIARNAAGRILARHPEIARDSIYSAVVCGDLAEVERILAGNPSTANEKGGAKKWEPLLYLCFTRLPLDTGNDNAVAIARMLLDSGADPNAYFMAGDSLYTPMVGAIGEGEENRLPHPQRDGLVQLLLERGADPYDMQVFYNIHFHGDIIWLLELIYAHTVKTGRGADWDDPEWSMIDEGGYGLGARYLLDVAVSHNNLELAEWILTHGATANPLPPPHHVVPKYPLHEEALRRGFTEMADLLVRFGATPSGFVLDSEQAFAAACFELDRSTARSMLEQHPEYLQSPIALHAAAKHDRVDVVQLLLDLGVSPDVEDAKQGRQRALHVAAYDDSPRVAALLIERGAEIDPVETNWGNTPLDSAVYAQNPRMIELLGRFSRDIWNLTFTGHVERVREVLSTEPGLAKVASHEYGTPLMWLPDDESRAIEIVELFLAFGADPALRNSEGKTAADRASERGMDDVAALLRSL